MSRPARDPQSRLCMCGTTPRQSYRWRRSLAWCSGAGSSTPRRARYATPCSPSSTSAPCAPSLTRGYALAPSPLPRLLCRTLRLGSLSRWRCYSREQVWIGREAFVSTPLPAACLKCRLGPGRADRPRAAPPYKYMPSAGHYIHTLHVVCMYKERGLNFGGEPVGRGSPNRGVASTCHVCQCSIRPGKTNLERRSPRQCRRLVSWRGAREGRAGEAIVTREREGLAHQREGGRGSEREASQSSSSR
mmetsp:Transcript_28178/g.90350  ORF Transcript_28178/g.90350 Transcript_28178/m.90350 type:complete len:246 (+) Transcript_28178:235-972(+)